MTGARRGVSEPRRGATGPEVPAELVVRGGIPLRGRLCMPGCKGISHRALLLASVAEGRCEMRGLARGADVASTMAVLGVLGPSVRAVDDGLGSRHVLVTGAGWDAWREPVAPLDCGNSGSTLRMAAGMLAGRPFLSILAGDASLSERPMRRIVEPLREMGATVDGRRSGTRAPLVVRGGALTASTLTLARASGQVKTGLLFAGLQTAGVTEIREPAPSRDHTERLMAALGVPIESPDPTTVRVRPATIPAFDLDVPGDPSSAAFLVVAASIVPGSSIVIEGVSLNPGRIAYVDVLRRMGADIEVVVAGESLGEPFGDLVVESAPLHGTVIDGDEAIVDELPVLAVAGAFAEGITEIRGAAELAVKESNRIATLQQELIQMGVTVDAHPDGLVVHGGSPHAAILKSHGDHRIALCAAVAGLAAPGDSRVRGWPAVSVSYPEFAGDIAALQAAL